MLMSCDDNARVNLKRALAKHAEEEPCSTQYSVLSNPPHVCNKFIKLNTRVTSLSLHFGSATFVLEFCKENGEK